MPYDRQKKIAVINDFCGFGRCSLAVSLPIISATGVQCCPLPTAIFSNHTGYKSFFSTDFTDKMNPYIDEWVKLGLHFDGILSGYLGSEEQIGIVKRFLSEFKREDTVTVIDPVMGDGGHVYSSYSPSLAKKMVELVGYADILTPNLTEACILTGRDYKEDITDEALFDICSALGKMGPEKIVISGLDRGDTLENYIYEKGCKPTKVCVSKVGECRCGTGDVFASIIAADAVLGVGIVDSVRHASDFISKVLKRTLELDIPKTDGVCFEEFLKEI